MNLVPTKIPHYHARWVAKRRAAFFADKRCLRCGSSKKLELDHVDPAKKVGHAIWSWSETRRLEEISKCQILCNRCHRKKTAEENRQRFSGRPNLRSRVLSDEQVAEIRQRIQDGQSHRFIGAAFGISSATVCRIRQFRTYRFPVGGSGEISLPRQT